MTIARVPCSDKPQVIVDNVVTALVNALLDVPEFSFGTASTILESVLALRLSRVSAERRAIVVVRLWARQSANMHRQRSM